MTTTEILAVVARRHGRAQLYVDRLLDGRLVWTALWYDPATNYPTGYEGMTALDAARALWAAVPKDGET